MESDEDISTKASFIDSLSAYDECAICCEVLILYAAGNCGHKFCKNCMREYLFNQLSNKVRRVYCPNDGCKAPFSGRLFAEIYNITYKKHLPVAPEMIRCRICNYPSIRIADRNGFFKCSQCIVKYHIDINTDELITLYEEYDLYTIGLMRCYNCRRFIEKTYGCDHMVCVCKAEFCYLCGAIWSQHNECDRAAKLAEEFYGYTI